METVLISKEKLLKKLKENRDTHKATYEDTRKRWEESVIDELALALENARDKIEFKTYFNLPEPEDHTPEYDAVIDQIEWSENDQIELTFHQFNQFVRDDWAWKRDFMSNTALYMHKKLG